MRSAAWSPPATRARAAASWLRVASSSIRSSAPAGDGSASPWQRSSEDVAHLGANVIPHARDDARLFLHRPDIIVLDEATAALDSRSQDRLMGLLSREFTDATVISIGHRPELAAFHQRKIVLERSRKGAKLVDGAAGGAAAPGWLPERWGNRPTSLWIA